MEEIDIWRSAHLLIKQHGENAGAAAAAKFVECQKAEDGNGMAVWTAVMAAIWELAEARPEAGDALN